MPLYEIEGSQAFGNRDANREAAWPTRAEATNRVEPIAAPAFKPSFSLAPGESVFTIGSCFARNVEHHLDKLGFDVPMRRLNIESGPAEAGEADTSVFNNYGVPSILNELEWAIDPDKPFDPKTCLFESTEGKFFDLHLMRLMKAVPLDVALARRARIREGMASVVRCRVVIMTLGLVEVWWDAQSGRYLNIAPPKLAVKQFAGRFSLRVMSYGEIVNTLHRIVRLLQDFGAPGHRLVLTVSPIPLSNTFTTQDVMIANSYSKSALRTAVQEIWSSYDHVDYFPSYESFVLSDRKLAFQEDMRHATTELIELNVNRMVAAYAGESAGTSAKALAESAEKAKQWNAAARHYLDCVKADREDKKAQLGLARCLGEIGKPSEAIEILHSLLEDPSHRIQAGFALARVAQLAQDRPEFRVAAGVLQGLGTLQAYREILSGAWAIGDMRTVEDYLPDLEEKHPRSALLFEYRARLALRKGNKAAAEKLLQQGIALNPSAPRCFMLLADLQLAAGRRAEAAGNFKRVLAINPGSRKAREGLQKAQDAVAAE